MSAPAKRQVDPLVDEFWTKHGMGFPVCSASGCYMPSVCRDASQRGAPWCWPCARLGPAPIPEAGLLWLEWP